jgi:hypothetical protein
MGFVCRCLSLFQKISRLIVSKLVTARTPMLTMFLPMFLNDLWDLIHSIISKTLGGLTIITPTLQTRKLRHLAKYQTASEWRKDWNPRSLAPYSFMLCCCASRDAPLQMGLMSK